MQQLDNTGFLGCGGVILAPYLPTGVFSNQWYDMGEMDKFEITENVELKERPSKKCATIGQLASSVARKQPASLSMTMTTVNTDNFSTLFMADVKPLEISAGTFADVATANLNRMTRTSVPNINSVVVKNFDDTVTYAIGVDYDVVNSEIGLICYLDTGAIMTDDVVHITGSNLATNQLQIKGGSQTGRRFKVLFTGRNQENNKKVNVEVFDVVLIPESGVDFLADDFIQGSLTGKPVIDQIEETSYIVNNEVVHL